MAANEASRALTGVVVDGKVVLQGNSLPDGARVAVRVLEPNEDAETFDVTPEEKADLLASIAEADRGEGMDAYEHLQRLRGGVGASSAD